MNGMNGMNGMNNIENENRIFRPMVLSDRDEMCALFDEMGEESAGFFNIGRCNEKMTMRFFSEGKDEKHSFFVAAKGSAVLGYCFLWELEKSVPWFGVAVREKYKGQHVGTFLLEGTLAMLKEKGYGGLLLTTAKTNLRGQALYEKCGFERLGVHESGEYLYLRRF